MTRIPECRLTFVFKSLVRKFACARQGNIALISALLMPPMMVLAGGTIDFMYAVRSQSKLEQAARIASSTATITARRLVNNAPAGANADSMAIQEAQKVGMASFLNQTSGLPNLMIDLVNTTITVARNGDTFNATLNYSANQNTIFAKVVGYTTIPLTGAGSMVVGVSDVPVNKAIAPKTAAIIAERWSPIQATTPNAPINDWSSGTPGTQLPTMTPAKYPAVFDNPAVNAAIRVGSLDGSISPIISKKAYMPAGKYELRYWYKSTIVYPEYEPAYICGTIEDEMNWVNASDGRNPNPAGWRQGDPVPSTRYVTRQTSRAGVYLDPIETNPQLATTPPDASTFPRPPLMYNPNLGIVRGDSSLGNRIDICAYSSRWIERTVTIQVSKSAYYWLSFVAEPPQGEMINGFYLGPLQLCPNACGGSVNNNFPWSAGTVLYQDSFEGIPSAGQGYPFDKKSRGFTTEAKYENPPDWEFGAYGGFQPAADSFAYDTSGRIDGATSVMTQKLSLWLYRRMLLMPGVYLVDFKDALGKAMPAVRWCPTINLDPAGSSITTWYLTDTSDPAYDGTCTCPAGAITTIITSDEKVHTQTNLSTNGGLAGSGFTGSAPSGYKNTRDPNGSAMGDCHFSTNVVPDRYCFLAPRTQYYGFQFRVNGVYMTTTAGTQFAGFDPQLGAGNAYLDQVKVTLLSPGVKNKLNTDTSGVGDFDDYYNKCSSRLVTASTAATSANVISGGVPMWPGRSVKQLNGLTVTAPLPN